MATRKKTARTGNAPDRVEVDSKDRCEHCGAHRGECEAPARRRRPSPARYDADEARAAPWGRRPDGTPHTLEEFRAFLRETVRELYGVTLTVEAVEPAAAIASTRRASE